VPAEVIGAPGQTHIIELDDVSPHSKMAVGLKTVRNIGMHRIASE